jgi:hypothetical protein
MFCSTGLNHLVLCLPICVFLLSIFVSWPNCYTCFSLFSLETFNFKFPVSPSATGQELAAPVPMVLGSTRLLTEMNTRNLPVGKSPLARNTDNLTAIFLPLGVTSCCASIQLGFLWRRQSRQSFNTSTPHFLFFLLTHYMFRSLQAIFRWDIQLDVYKDYSFYNGSAVRTQLDVCLWSPIHVIKLSIKVVKTLIFTVKLVSYIKYKNVKIQGE